MSCLNPRSAKYSPKEGLRTVRKPAMSARPMTINPKRAEERLRSGVKKFQTMLAAAQTRDANESDTVTIIVRCWRRYLDSINTPRSRGVLHTGTFCDLALKLAESNKPSVLIEARSRHASRASLDCMSIRCALSASLSLSSLRRRTRRRRNHCRSLEAFAD